MATGGRRFPRNLKQAAAGARANPNHIGPARAHMRAQKEKVQAEAPSSASFPTKSSAFLRSEVFGWLKEYLKFRFGRKHTFQTYPKDGDNGVYAMAGDSFFSGGAAAEEIRISLTGDWATGTREAFDVAEAIKAFHPHYSIHLGDVYFVGDTEELKTNCLGNKAPNGAPGLVWPIGANGSFAMNGNHEMYANGNAYFDLFLPALGVRPGPGAAPGKQKASFFCLRNEFWNVIGIDTGYNSIGLPILEKIFKPSCQLEDELLKWLRETVRLQDDHTRGVVILSHHQYYSAFDEMYAKPAEQLAKLIDRPVLWFWGHEHRMAVYGKHQKEGAIAAFGRCIGHGGMPVDIGVSPDSGRNLPLVVYDDRPFVDMNDPDLKKAGFNGFANLKFWGNELTVEYRDVTNQVTLVEQWEVWNGQLAGKKIELIEPRLTRLGDLRAAIGRG